MKKLAMILLALWAFTACSDDDFERFESELTTICCYDEFNDEWKTIKVNEVVLRRHLEHGDQMSPCSETDLPEEPM